MVDSGDYAALRAESQRYNLFCVPFGVFQARTYTTIGETTITTTIGVGSWAPVLNIGSHRLAFVGEAISFDALRSFERGEGVGAGTVSGGTWNFNGGTASGTSGLGPHTVSWATTGLKEITYTVGSTVAKRWVRVVADRDTTFWDVISVSSVAGSIENGWSAQITIMPNDDDGTPVSIADFQCIGLFAEDLWDDGAGYVKRVIGGYDPDPRVVMIGYVKEGSVSRDANTHSVSFSIEGLAGQLANVSIHKTACWEGTTPSNFGTIFTGLSSMKITDAALFILQFKTNVLGQHDFYTYWSSDLQPLETVEGQEGSVWSVLESWTKASFLNLFVDAGGGLRMAPDRQTTDDPQWDATFPPRMIFTDDLMLELAVSEDKQRNVIYVQLVMTSTRSMKQRTADYPDGGPPTGAGSWFTRKDLLGQSQAWLDAIVIRVYNVANRKWSGQITTGLNRAVEPGDLLAITTDLSDRDVIWTAKSFICDSVTYEINPGAGTWKTTLHILEDVL